ncbi:MAG: type II toxin-antitoxin system HicA family toxin [Sedimentisphaerales bacterium]|nr:type II toxin-antitoxin system HicA family toxin [Sedimentisphaerales bacterium]
MKLPREISGKELAGLLKRYGYEITRQTGSHMRLTTDQKGVHHITIPNHKSLKIGTLSSILSDVAVHFKMDKSDLIEEIF